MITKLEVALEIKFQLDNYFAVSALSRDRVVAIDTHSYSCSEPQAGSNTSTRISSRIDWSSWK